MAALPTQNPTLKDLAAATGADGVTSSVVELLTASNEILDDMTWQQGNLTTGHRSMIRAGLPLPTWRKFYQGVQPNKGTLTQITDQCGNLEAYSEIDKGLADLNGNSREFRALEDYAHIQGMNNTMAQTIFYGNDSAIPAAFNGLAPRYNAINGPNAENVIDALGTGSDNASIWLVYWSPQTVFGIVPKGSVAGLQVRDLGESTIQDATGVYGGGNGGGRFQVYTTHYKWTAGLCVRDWRAVVRIANIDKSDLTKTAATGADLADLMFQALEVVPQAVASMGRPAFYLNRSALTALRRQVANKTSGSTLAIEDVGGRKVRTFQGVPLRRVDALAADEARVV